jgi:2-keto-4-pentenoate hydratase/2-oxohepta-3-ene-1,7-dioic acid hydratase in catechol pathway
VKLATFVSGGLQRVGLVHADDRKLFDLAKAAERDGVPDPAFSSMLSLIDGGDGALERAELLFLRGGREDDLSVDVNETKLLAPVPVPRQMRDGMSFPVHIVQSRRGGSQCAAGAAIDTQFDPLVDLPDVYRRQPIYYFTNRFSVQGHDATVFWPSYSQIMDYELEFGIFTRRSAANISAGQARRHIFGYTIFNDFSARDAQKLEMEGRLGPMKGKSFDGGNVLGPWIVTPDEIGDPYDLGVEVRVNGRARASEKTKGMLFSFEEIIAYASRNETLIAGEFIGSGTVGNCCGLETGRYLEHGDVVELDVENIGVLRNKVERRSE